MGLNGKCREAVHFIKANGEDPFQDFLDKLKDAKGKARILTRVNRAEQGNFGDYKSLKEQLFELRIDHGPGYRVYFGIINDDTVILLMAGGSKGSQQKDIEEAKKNLANFLLEEKKI